MNIKSVVHNIMIYCTKSLILYVQVQVGLSSFGQNTSEEMFSSKESKFVKFTLYFLIINYYAHIKSYSPLMYSQEILQKLKD